MDPIAHIKPWKDTTMAMLLAAQQRGWELRYMEPDWLYARDGHAYSRMAPLNVRDDNQDWYTLGPIHQGVALADLDIILMRQDPPVNMEFLYVTQLLELAERDGVCVANRPAAIRETNEKLFAQHFSTFCPPSLVTSDIDELDAFLHEQQQIVVKPLDAMGGASVFRIVRGDPNAGVIFETMTDNGRKRTLAQRFIPAVTEGDRRILLINGQPVDYALLRVPPKGEFRANLAAGGHGVPVPLRDRDRDICAAIGPELARRGLWFVGLDVIGNYLTEINVTSPTCAREIDAAYNTDIGGQFMDFLQRHALQH